VKTAAMEQNTIILIQEAELGIIEEPKPSEIFVPDRVLSKDEILKRSNPFKRICGIYFLISANKIVYIGQSVDIYSRVAGHKKEGKKRFSRMAYIEASVEKIGGLEMAYKSEYKPKYNKKDLPWHVYPMV